MKRVLATRSAAQSGEFIETLARLGVETVCVPVTEVVPTDDWTACDNALADIESYDALVFTSGNGVRYFIERMARVGKNCDELPAGFGLGKQTKAVMNDCGLTVAPTDDAINAATLAEEICMLLTNAGLGGVEGMKFLFPCGDLARNELSDSLESHGAIVERVVVYQAKRASREVVDRIGEMLSADEVACIAFFAPSQVDAVANTLSDVATRSRHAIRAAAIGETTAAILRTLGITPEVVASRPEQSIFAQEIAAKL